MASRAQHHAAAAAAAVASPAYPQQQHHPHPASAPPRAAAGVSTGALTPVSGIPSTAAAPASAPHAGGAKHHQPATPYTPPASLAAAPGPAEQLTPPFALLHSWEKHDPKAAQILRDKLRPKRRWRVLFAAMAVVFVVFAALMADPLRRDVVGQARARISAVSVCGYPYPHLPHLP